MPKASIHKDTCTIFLQHQITKSGCPGNFGELSLYRNPLLHNPFRTIISGFVSLEWIAAIVLCRCSGESLSIRISQSKLQQALSPAYCQISLFFFRNLFYTSNDSHKPFSELLVKHFLYYQGVEDLNLQKPH